MHWENGKSNISNLELGPTLDRIMENKVFFEEVLLVHIYKEFNHKANKLSKEALILEEWCFRVHDIKDYTPIDLIHLKLF